MGQEGHWSPQHLLQIKTWSRLSGNFAEDVEGPLEKHWGNSLDKQRLPSEQKLPYGQRLPFGQRKTFA